MADIEVCVYSSLFTDIFIVAKFNNNSFCPVGIRSSQFISLNAWREQLYNQLGKSAATVLQISSLRESWSVRSLALVYSL